MPDTNVTSRRSASAGPPIAVAASASFAGSSARPVALAVLAGDPLTGEGAVAHLRNRPEVRVLGGRASA